jgi:hypothetical protein
MTHINTARMKEQEERDLKWSKFMEYIDSDIKVSERPFRVADDDPFLVRKLEEAYKTFEEAPIPDFLLKRMDEKD